MSDLMLFDVLQMPYEMAMNDELSRVQFYQRAQQALDRIAELEKDLHMIQRHYDQLNTHPVKELTDEDLEIITEALLMVGFRDAFINYDLKEKALAILRKAQEK